MHAHRWTPRVCPGPRTRASPTAVPSGGCSVRWVCRSAPHRPAAIPPRAAGPVCLLDLAGLLPGLPHMPKVVRCSAGWLYTALHGHSRSRSLRTRFTDFPYSVDMHTWTNLPSMRLLPMAGSPPPSCARTASSGARVSRVAFSCISTALPAAPLARSQVRVRLDSTRAHGPGGSAAAARVPLGGCGVIGCRGGLPRGVRGRRACWPCRSRCGRGLADRRPSPGGAGRRSQQAARSIGRGYQCP